MNHILKIVQLLNLFHNLYKQNTHIQIYLYDLNMRILFFDSLFLKSYKFFGLSTSEKVC